MSEREMALSHKYVENPFPKFLPLWWFLNVKWWLYFYEIPFNTWSTTIEEDGERKYLLNLNPKRTANYIHVDFH